MKMNFLVFCFFIVSFQCLNAQVLIITSTGDSIISEIIDETPNQYVIELKKNSTERRILPKSMVANIEKFANIEYLERRELFIGANKIIIFNDLSFDDNFNKVGKLLIDKGFNLKEKEREFGIIITESIKTYNRSFIGGYLEYFIKASINGNIIELSCYGAYTDMEKEIASFQRAKTDYFLLGEGVYGKGKTIQEPWNRLKEIATDLKGTTIKYVYIRQ